MKYDEGLSWLLFSSVGFDGESLLFRVQLNPCAIGIVVVLCASSCMTAVQSYVLESRMLVQSVGDFAKGLAKTASCKRLLFARRESCCVAMWGTRDCRFSSLVCVCVDLSLDRFSRFCRELEVSRETKLFDTSLLKNWKCSYVVRMQMGSVGGPSSVSSEDQS